MTNSRHYLALGLMSGTSADGIDIALIKTNGENQILLKSFGNYSFSKEFTKKMKKNFTKKINKKNLKKKYKELEKEFTNLNYLAIKEFLKKKKINKNNIDVIGFHGQTISHNPQQGYSYQLGDSKRLSNLLKIKVVANFRDNDIKYGGEGAPLTPIFHYYLTKKIKKKICFLNLGGIANITWIDHTKQKKGVEETLAYDVGPCCSLLDDWVSFKTNERYDNCGNYAKKGKPNLKIVQTYLKNNFFLQKPPKSLDRSDFSIKILKHLSLHDGSATLSKFIIECLKNSLTFLPSKPDLFIVSGGGRKNNYLMNQISTQIETRVKLSEDFNWNGDSIEAYAFGFLSVRRLLKLPVSFPRTTKVLKPMIGGKIFEVI